MSGVLVATSSICVMCWVLTGTPDRCRVKYDGGVDIFSSQV
jgi:hypothetical protein